MAKRRPKEKSKRGASKRSYALVQASNGKYYLVSAEPGTVTTPVKDQSGLKKFLEDLDDLLSDYLEKHQGPMVAGPGVHLAAPDIFPN
jgi:hypothetical protein